MTTERADAFDLPAEVTLEEAARLLGCHRTTAFRKFRRSLRWAMHRKRRVQVVQTKLVIRAIAEERNQGPALPEIDRISEKMAAIILIQERQAIWAAKVARKLGVAV